MAEKNPKLTFTVNVRLEQAEEKEAPDTLVYAFDSTGQLLASAPLPEGAQGEVKLELPAELVGATVRVFAGPLQAPSPTWAQSRAFAELPPAFVSTAAGRVGA